jgi:hypothetical protein
MIDRKVYRDDNLGMAEILNEVLENGNSIPISLKFYLSFTKNRH